MFIFPDNEAPVVEHLSNVAIADENPIEITLADKVKDADSNNASIIKSINKVADESIVKAEIVKGNLLLTPLKKGTTSVELAFNSNGKVTTKTHISAVCKRKRKTCGKHPITGQPLTWRYI